MANGVCAALAGFGLGLDQPLGAVFAVSPRSPRPAPPDTDAPGRAGSMTGEEAGGAVTVALCGHRAPGPSPRWN